MVRTWRVLTCLLVCGPAMEMHGKGPLPVVRQGQKVTSTGSLRSRGPEGLAQALKAYDALQQRDRTLREEMDRLVLDYEGNKEPVALIERQLVELQSRIERAATAIDQIGGQRSCTVSRLYWYTDLAAAKAAGDRTGRPILSLRMLGKLTDEFSCANSRFFRTALYSNKEISDYLRDNFVLHWQSVRPVPRVTIDFGDGRKLERTLTGNSAHYVLTSEGQPLDVLPGLYGPRQFAEWLTRLRHFHAAYVALPAEKAPGMLQTFHTQRGKAVMQQWDADLERLQPELSSAVLGRLSSFVRSEQPVRSAKSGSAPPAADAAELTAPKRAAEIRIMRFANLGGERLERAMDGDAWQAVANLHRAEVKLDDASVALMGREFPVAEVAGRVSVSKAIQEDPVLRMVRSFEQSMSVDTVRNEYLLHRRIHEHFANGQAATADADALNEWVYAELFLTPSSDPWLGLAPRDVYTALDNDGRTVPPTDVASGGRAL